MCDLEPVVIPGQEAELDARRVGDADNHVPLEDEEAPEERAHLGEQAGDGLVGGPRKRLMCPRPDSLAVFILIWYWSV